LSLALLVGIGRGANNPSLEESIVIVSPEPVEEAMTHRVVAAPSKKQHTLIILMCLLTFV
jgi:hypothetical protein